MTFVRSPIPSATAWIVNRNRSSLRRTPTLAHFRAGGPRIPSSTRLQPWGNFLLTRRRLQSTLSSLQVASSQTLQAENETAVEAAVLPDEINISTGLGHYLDIREKETKNDSSRSECDVERLLEEAGIKSRPIEGGNWNVEHPLRWAENFGRRSKEYDVEVKAKARLRPGDEGYFDVSHLRLKNVTMVRTVEDARKVVDTLMKSNPAYLHACDTEVMDIDLNSVGPVGNGYVTCVSIYSGPDFDYGLGDGPGTTLWIDNLDDAFGVLQEFKVWFEDERFLKVWHNYGFDRHVMWNEGIDVRGFGGDTMHMARLQNTARNSGQGTGYSLEALTAELLDRRKAPMKELFGVKRIRKDGSEGSLVDIPPVEVLQRNPEFRAGWIEYSCFDAESTWHLRERLQRLLEAMDWYCGHNLFKYYWDHMRPFGEVLTDMERRGIHIDATYLQQVEQQAIEERNRLSINFRQWAQTKIGPDGLALNPASSLQLNTFLFGGAANSKTKVKTETERVFKVPREELPADALEAYEKRNSEKQVDDEPDGSFLDNLDKLTLLELKEVCKEQGLKVSGTKDALRERIRANFAQQAVDHVRDEFDLMSREDLEDALIARNLPTNGDTEDLKRRLREDIDFANLVSQESQGPLGDVLVNAAQRSELMAQKSEKLERFLIEKAKKEAKPSKFVDVKVTSLGLTPTKFTAGGAPSVTADVLRDLAGNPFADPPKYGVAKEKLGEDGCKALFSLCSIGSIDTMIANFLTSLQDLVDAESRVHCSLNLNTETGRLSSRRPNLQNQPALEKDKYKIRQAFKARPGNSLIVADYGQLELRILASMTNCKSMIDAFAAGGDFHSRTAIDMFKHIQESLAAGECLLEWDTSKGEPDKPLVKDKFGSERRRAKGLNFSIAYGKTAHGLSKDWGVTKEEAEEMLKKWYEARPEVLDWQTNTKATAKNQCITRTLMGRYRHLPEAKSSNRASQGHAERASINTPIQGGAADIAMMAMNKINANEKLKQLGWILLLQIHDEVILEGPEETAEEAFGIVVQCMEEPWVYGLDKTAVPLVVDGSYSHKTWYDAK